MLKRFRSSLLIGILLVSLPAWLSAKAPTVRITLAGGKLAHSIQITDIELLNLSNAWGEGFLDTSKPALKERPKVNGTYEVTFYSGAEEDIRKTCVFYYSPGSSAAQGVIYLPGIDASLNSGTIIRQGRDGKWSYASPAWEALIKALIARGESEGGLSTRKSSGIAVENWSKPQPGWLYVLDARSGPHSRVWLLDPETSKVMGSIRAGYDPDFALSPNGNHLYLTSGERESGELTVVDTSTGKLRHIPFADRVLYKAWYEGLPPISGLVVSSDGQAVWVPGYHVFSPERIESRVWIFDTRTEGFLARTVELGKCGYVGFVPSAASNRYEFFCESFPADSTRIRLMELDRKYTEISSTTRDFAWTKGCAVAGVYLSRTNKLTMIRTDGVIYEADSPRQKLNSNSIASDCVPWSVVPTEWPRSPDGAKVYVGYGGLAPDGMSAATELRVFDTTTGKQLGSLQTSVPFWSATISHDGKYLYAVAPAQRKVLVIDAATLQEKRAIEIGSVPSLALVAP